VEEAFEAIQKKGKKTTLIVKEKHKILGLFTDGDMRRHILSGGDLSVMISEVMNKRPVVFNSRHEAIEYSKDNKMLVYPVVDNKGILEDVVFWNDNGIEHPTKQLLSNVPIVIMAGGKGTRLYPYTKVLPKPLIPIGEKTICEQIISTFTKYGAKDFYIILNHMKNMIKAYFNEVDKKYSLNYIDEDEFLGTGGGLSLLKNIINETFILSNCDILIDVDYSDFYQYHNKEKNTITFMGAVKNFEIPYGVINMKPEGGFDGITEKPSYSHIVNTGVYVIESKVIDNLNYGECIDLPQIAQQCVDANERIGVYPISEKSYMDMGQHKEMEKMISALSY